MLAGGISQRKKKKKRVEAGGKEQERGPKKSTKRSDMERWQEEIDNLVEENKGGGGFGLGWTDYCEDKSYLLEEFYQN